MQSVCSVSPWKAFVRDPSCICLKSFVHIKESEASSEVTFKVLKCSQSSSNTSFLDGSAVKNLPAMAGNATPGWRRSPGEGNGNPLQYSCLEKSQGQRSLVGYTPWGHKELDTTEQLSTKSSTVRRGNIRRELGAKRIP